MKNITRYVVAFLIASVLSLSAYAQGRELPDFADLVEKHGPAVVNISITQVIKNNRNSFSFGQPFGLDESDPAFEFFRRFMPPGSGQSPRQQREFRQSSLGSGFIVSADGYILTNAHVVDDADEVIVKLTDKRELKAKVIGSDKRSDVALLKVEATNLPVVKMGDSSKVRVGEWVVAIGSPFGFENSVTAGIVSAKGRELPQENLVPFIQTDVAINPGNSGGPLFSLKGEVIGMNSQIFSRSGGSIGLSFSIPIDLAMDVQNQLRSNGKVSRGRLGVVIQGVTKELAESFGLSKPVGALVASVEKGAPADKAGLVTGDIILKFDGKAINQSSDLPRLVSAAKPGSKVTMQIWKGGANRDLQVTVGETPDDEESPRQSRKGGKDKESPTANRLGLVLTVPSADRSRALGLTHGLIVEEVRNGSLRTDLRAGDVILSIMTKGGPVDLKSVSQFNDLLGQIDKSSAVTLLVRRGDSQTFVTIKGINEKTDKADKSDKKDN
jgi:serine protease Do